MQQCHLRKSLDKFIIISISLLLNNNNDSMISFDRYFATDWIMTDTITYFQK